MVSRICRSRASFIWKSRSSARSSRRRCSSLASSSRASVSALASWASLSRPWVSFIWARISSSRENFSASRSREAFSGSRLASASESRNIRSSSSVIWAATFSWVKPIVSRSEVAGAFGVPAGCRGLGLLGLLLILRLVVEDIGGFGRLGLLLLFLRRGTPRGYPDGHGNQDHPARDQQVLSEP